MSKEITTVLIAGAGKAGMSLIETFHGVDNVRIVAVVDQDANAPGMRLARKKSIPTGTDCKAFCELDDLDVILNVTGDERLKEYFHQHKPYHTEVTDGRNSRFIWMLVNELNNRKAHEAKCNLMQQKIKNFSHEILKIFA